MDLELANLQLMAALQGIAEGAEAFDHVATRDFGRQVRISDALAQARLYLREDFDDPAHREIAEAALGQRNIASGDPFPRKDVVAHRLLESFGIKTGDTYRE